MDSRNPDRALLTLIWLFRAQTDLGIPYLDRSSRLRVSIAAVEGMLREPDVNLTGRCTRE